MELREAYEKVKNHPYRVDRIGNPRDYGEAVEDLAEVFHVNLKDNFFDGKYSMELGFKVIHDICAIGGHLTSYGDAIIARKETTRDLNSHIAHDMLVVEKYLNQIHAYLDTGVFVTWKGYYCGCNPHPGWYTLKFNLETKKFEHIDWKDDPEVTRYGYFKTDKGAYCPECKVGETSIHQLTDGIWSFKCDKCGYVFTKVKE